MGNFKAGDEAILVSVEPQWKVPVGTKVRVRETCVGGAGPGYFVELSTEPGSSIYYAEHRLGSVDDHLPPAPESALYINAWHWGVEVKNLGDEVRIGTGSPDSLGYQWCYATLDPDTALQLAHDLRRMAMEIKRKDKQND